ncbi:hypothetical protein G9A89_023735 [Geosiphon pyriformis]|nr:hypothetical protein G9A89_023735 [Geosiphon pyriformis]
MLASCISEVGIGVALCKGFVFDDWFHESVLVFKDSKEGTKRIVSFVHEFCLAFQDDIWLVRAKHRVFMKRHGLIPCDGSILVSISGLPAVFLAGVIRLLGVAEAFGISFGFCKLCSFFSGIEDTVSVHIVGSSAGGSGSVLAGLKTRQNAKKKCIDMVYSWNASYKKPKKPTASNVVDSSARSLSLEDIGGASTKPVVSWGSEIGSVASSVSGLLDVEDMANTVAEETCYVESGENVGMDKTTLRKTCTQTYMLGNPLKQLLFDCMSDDNDALELPPPKFDGANQVLHIRSRAPVKRNFEPVKFFALDIEVSAVPEKTNVDKLMAIKKIFYRIDGFGGASTLSKFSGVIRSTFTSELSLDRAKDMAISEKIMVNNNFRKVNSHSDREVIIKEIPVDLPKSVVKTVFSKFGKIVSIKMQLIGLWQKTLVEFESLEVADLVAARWFVFVGKNSVRVAKTVDDKQSWVSRDRFRALLYTLLIGTTAHDLSELVEAYDGKTCFIDHNPTSYVYDQCAVICFESEASKLATIGLVPAFKGVGLRWTGLSLVSCTYYKLFNHIAVNCSVGRGSGGHEKHVVTSQNRVRLANIYRKKQVPIVRPAQVAGGSPSCVVSSGAPGVGLISGSKAFSMNFSSSGAIDLGGQLAVSLILKKLSFIDLVSLAPLLSALFLVSPTTVVSDMDSGLASDSMLSSFVSSLFNVGKSFVDFSSSSSKVLTAKIGSLESNMVALEALICSVLGRLNHLHSGLSSSLVWKFAMCNVQGINVSAKQADIVRWHVNLRNMVSFITETKLRLDKGFMGAGVAIIMNISLACHVFKVEEIPGRVVSVRLLFKSRLLITVLGLYAGVSSGARFGQASEVNSLIAKAVNSSNFVILGGDFNENGSGKSASFKFCLSLGLVNSFVGHYLANSHTWSNSREVGKTIDYIFVGGNLSSAVAGHQVVSVSDFFDTDHRAVVVSVSLGGLLDVQLNSLCKQTNKDCWKFKIKNADCAGWAKFKDLSLAKLLSLGEVFSGAEIHGDVDAIEFKCSRNKHSSKFFGLKLLVAKIVKKFCSGDLLGTNCFMSKWLTLDDAKACAFKDLVGSGVKSDVVVRHLSLVCRDYRRSKMFESRLAEEALVRKVIEKCIDNFCSDKGSMIRSVLKKPFHKVVLNHLIVDNDLVLLPEEVKSSMDKIIERWTRKCSVQSELPDFWTRQYALLDHVWDDAFSGVMSAISMGELLSVVGSLPDGKTAGLSGVPNELWKHGGEGTSTQSPVFAVGLVIEDAMEKNKELWLVLQDMQKAYDSVGWHYLRASLQHVKMCERFIRFFGGIHEDRVNRVKTDFGLSGDYKVHNRLDQSEVFLPLLWRIFYDPLLCKVKRHEQLYGYWIDTKFVSKSGRIESGSGLISYFSAGAFAFTQYALNIASEFFVINDISINSEKTVAIPINQGVKVALLSIYGQPISIAKKGEAHWYLGIFLSTERLSKPNVVKAYVDVCFFVNVVLRKAITDKQFSYLVSAVLQPIVSYCIQFSFVFANVCRKWDVLIRKSLRFKACLPCDFSDTALHHPSLYGLKLFEQVQSERKVAALIMFSNAFGILGHLFRHRFLDLQVLGWAPLDPLQFSIRLHVSPVNNFLAEMRLDLRGPVPYWFLVSSEFLKSQSCSFSGSIGSAEKLGLDILESGEFSAVKDGLHDIWSGFFEVFTDGSLRNAGSVEVICSAAAYFPVLDKSIGITVSGLLSSTIAKLQTVALALECVPFSSTVVLCLDSQAAIDTYVSEMNKDLSVSWVKIKGHSEIPGNVEAGLAAGAVSESPFSLCVNVREYFLVAEDVTVSGNARHFVRNIFRSVCCVHWEAGSGCNVVPDVMIGCIDWVVTAKAVHRRLLVVIRKRLYDKCYSSVLCLFCGGVEFSDYIFTCVHESGVRGEILAEASAHWSALASGFSASAVLQVLSQCFIDVGLYTLVCKGFVVELHCAKVWLARASHRMVMEKAGLVCDSGVVSGLSRGVSSVLFNGVVRLLGVANSFAVSFGHRKPYCFFSGLGGSVRVIIGV